MATRDKEMEALVAEQTKYFMEEAPLAKKEDVLKRIKKLQNKRNGKRED